MIKQQLQQSVQGRFTSGRTKTWNLSPDITLSGDKIIYTNDAICNLLYFYKRQSSAWLRLLFKLLITHAKLPIQPQSPLLSYRD